MTDDVVGELKALAERLSTNSKIEVRTGLRPFTDWCSHYAIIFDSEGHFLDSIKLDYKSPTFVWKGRGYNFTPSKSSFFKVQFTLSSRKYYFYNIESPDAIVLKNVLSSSPLNSAEYGVLLETDVLRKLNDLAKENWLAKLITPFNIIIVLVVIGAIYWLKSSGRL